MASWLIIVIVSIIYLVLLCGIMGAILIVVSKRIKERDTKIKEITKDLKHSQELLDAYGIKEINIGKDSD